MKELKILFLVLVALLAASEVQAQGVDCPALGTPPAGLVPDRALAKALFEQARQHYDEGKFREAAAAFVASYHAAPEDAQPALIYNVGKATERTGDLTNAAAFYRCYLATNPPDGEGRAEAEARLALIEQGVPQARVWTEPQPTVEPEIVPSPSTDRVNEEPAQPPRRIWTWVAAGVTGAALATGIGFGISSERKFQDLEDHGCAETRDGCSRGEVHAIERNQLIANIAFGVAGAGALATGALWFWEGSHATVGVKVNPNGASAIVRW